MKATVTIDPPICVLCEKKAVTTAIHIPVCEDHWQEYKVEAKQYLPDCYRPFKAKLLGAARCVTIEP